MWSLGPQLQRGRRGSIEVTRAPSKDFEGSCKRAEFWCPEYGPKLGNMGHLLCTVSMAGSGPESWSTVLERVIASDSIPKAWPAAAVYLVYMYMIHTYIYMYVYTHASTIRQVDAYTYIYIHTYRHTYFHAYILDI